MQYRRFGRTNLKMPVFSCGGMRFQDGWKDKPFEEIEPAVQANLEATIAAALAHGITHIETARGYGPSERQLGKILPGLPREQLIVQTKIGPSDDPDKFTAEFLDSLDRLQLEHVELLAIHGINDAGTLRQAVGEDGRGGCLRAARELQAAGKCRWVGFSTHGTLDVILDAIQSPAEHHGHRGFDYINLHWYYIFQRNWAAVEAATAADMGLFIISPSDKGGRLYDPPPKLVELCNPLSPLVFNDLFCLSRGQVQTLSVGAARASDFDEHLKTLKLLSHADRILPPILRRLARAMEQATGHASPEALSWDLPDHRRAPGGLNLPIIVWLMHLAAGWDLLRYARDRFNLMGNGGHWFPGEPPAKALAAVTDADLLKAATGSADPARVVALVRGAVDMLGGEQVQRASKG